MGYRILVHFAIVSMLIVLPTLAVSQSQQNSDKSTVAISGTIAKAEAKDSFLLDYDSGKARVEMDGWHKVNNREKVREGDKVRVYGRMSQDSDQTPTIKAKSLYLPNLGVRYDGDSGGSDAMGEADLESAQEVNSGDIAVTGRVKEIDDQTFTMNSGDQALTVDTADMDYDPLKHPGLRDRAVRVGDLVTVRGTLAGDLSEQGKLQAEAVVIRVNSRYGIDQLWDGANPRAPAIEPDPVL